MQRYGIEICDHAERMLETQILCLVTCVNGDGCLTWSGDMVRINGCC